MENISTCVTLNNGYTLGVLASGTMGTSVLNAIVNGLPDVATGEETTFSIPSSFIATVNSQKSAERLIKQFGSLVSVSVGKNEDLVKSSDVIILACKPYMAESILNSIPSEHFKKKVLISLLAGKTISQLSDLTGNNALIVRSMTNTPSKLGAGMTVISYPKDQDVSLSVKNSITWIFNKTGRSLVMDEKYMDVATALCGSGPAFCFLMIEALSDGAVRMGMPYSIAQECAAQVLHGAAQMVLEGTHPAVLRNAVSTPGGTTIGGLLVMEDGRVRSSIARAVEEATNIATELSKPKK